MTLITESARNIVLDPNTERVKVFTLFLARIAKKLPLGEVA